MASSTAKVLSAHACHVTAAQTSDAASAEAADVASAKTAAHVASATTMSTAAATATAGLGISSKKAAGKHCTCQNHHHSSSHDIFLLEWAGPSATGSRQPVACAKGKRQRRDGVEMEMIVCPLY
jgi:hypothetical protein